MHIEETKINFLWKNWIIKYSKNKQHFENIVYTSVAKDKILLKA